MSGFFLFAHNELKDDNKAVLVQSLEINSDVKYLIKEDAGTKEKFISFYENLGRIENNQDKIAEKHDKDTTSLYAKITTKGDKLEARLKEDIALRADNADKRLCQLENQ